MIAKIRCGSYKKKRSHRKKTVETVRMNDIEKKKIETYNNPETFFFKKEKKQIKKGNWTEKFRG